MKRLRFYLSVCAVVGSLGLCMVVAGPVGFFELVNKLGERALKNYLYPLHARAERWLERATQDCVAENSELHEKRSAQRRAT